MKTTHKEVDILVCERCNRELEIYDASRQDFYKDQYGCSACGRLICSQCDAGGDFSYRAYHLRICSDCLEKLTAKELLNRLVTASGRR